MGGNVPLGYRVEASKLVVVEHEAELVRRIFARFAALGSALKVARELNEAGEVTKRRPRTASCAAAGPGPRATSTRSWPTASYLGEAVHKGVAYPGEHAAIVDQEPGTGRTASWPSRPASAPPPAGPRCRCCSRG